jgi:SAM-dependent methyltransferase
VARFTIDPIGLARAWRALPWFWRNRRQWRRLNSNPSFRFRWSDAMFTSSDRFESAGTARGHYFWQDLWAAESVFASEVKEHVDIGSRIDGFVAHLLPACRVIYVDLRPIELDHPNFISRPGSILDLPFAAGSVASLSCLHVIEHIGLGRYGDPVDPEGHLKAAAELVRVLAPGGRLLLGTPVGTERLCFDAHRVFAPETIIAACAPARLVEFHLIPDDGAGVVRHASLAAAGQCRYGCGLFVFTRDSGDAVPSRGHGTEERR